MDTFSASLRSIGDVKPLPATVEISDGRLTIAAGSMEIGSWPLSDVHFEEIPTGYRMAAEGEQVIIELKDIDGFNVALRESDKKSRRRRDRKRTEALKPEPPPSARSATTDHRPASSPASARDRDEKRSGWTSKGLAFVDGTLERANKRFGPYLPDWVFTRAMFAIAFGALVLAIALPAMVSTFLLIAGVLMVTFGAVVYSDPMLASRWLPGRTTPQHVLLFGVAVLMMGVLLGVIAR
jgi:hypothetical protein